MKKNLLWIALAAAAVSASAQEMPLTLSITSEEDLTSPWAVVDGNNDKKTFVYDANTSSAKYTGSSSVTPADWVITPAVTLEGGKLYQITVNLKTNSSYGAQALEIYAGTSQDPADMVLFDTRSGIAFSNFSNVKSLNAFVPETDGQYHIGLKLTTATYYDMYIKSVTLDVVSPLPGVATEVDAHGVQSSELAGEVTWKWPTVTNFGTPLTSITGAKIYRGTSSYLSESETNLVGTAAYTEGEDGYFKDTTVPKAGRFYYKVVPYNENGDATGTSSYYSTWLGPDTDLAAPTNFVATPVNETQAALSWTLPVGKNGGYVDLSNVTWQIARKASTESYYETIAQSVSADQLPWTDTTLPGLGKYTYRIYNVVDGKSTTTMLESPAVIIGGYVNLPYKEEFSSNTATDLYTLLTTGTRNWYFSSLSMTFYGSNTEGYLVLPNMKFQAGQLYEISFGARVATTAKDYKVSLMTAPAIDAVVQTVGQFNVANKTLETKKLFFTVDNTGIYNLAISVNGGSDTNNAYVDDIVVRESFVAPDMVKELTVTPAEKGALAATVAWTNPTLKNNDEALEAIDKIEILRGETIVGTITEGENLTVGAKASFTDASIETPGTYEYTVRAYIGERPSDPVSATSAWVGPDTEIKAPVKVTAEKTSDTSASITWDIPEGKNGGYIDPAAISYVITRKGSQTVTLEENYTGEQPYVDQDVTGLGSYSYGVAAKFAGKTTTTTYSTSLKLGGAVELPYIETYTTASNELIDKFHGSGTRDWAVQASSKYYNAWGNPLDMYMALPPFKLQAGHVYRVSFVPYISSTVKGLEFLLGTEATIEALTTNLWKKEITAKSATAVTETFDFTVAEDGNYRLALHAYDPEGAAKNSNDLYVKEFKVEEVIEAAAAPADLTATPGEEGALSATLTWTNPDKTNTGNALPAIASVEIFRGTDLIATLTEDLTPGLEATYTDSEIPAAGKYTYYVSVNGSEEKASVETTWIGSDDTVKKLTAPTATAQGDGAVITWEQPEGYNGGYVNTQLLTYTVMRDNGGDKVTIASDITETTCTDNELPKLGKYTYWVTVKYNGTASAAVESNAVVSGGALDIPYTQTFNTAASIDLFTLFNVAPANKNWAYMANKTALRYWGADANAYAVLPVFNLKKGHAYAVSFKAWLEKATSTYDIKLLLGTSATAEGLDTQLTVAEVRSTLSEEFTAKFSVPEDGRYYIALAITEGGNINDVFVDDINITETVGLPSAPQTIMVQAGENEALTATVTVTLPVLDTAGNPLDEISSLVVMRGETTVATVTEGLTPGAQISVEDTVDNAGEYSYSAYVTLGDSQSEALASEALWIGPDAPKTPENAVATVVYDTEAVPTVTIRWDAVTEGIHGAVFVPQNVTYSVYRMPGNLPVAEDIAETTCDDAGAPDLDMGKYYYLVVAQYNNSDSQPAQTPEIKISGAVNLPYQPDFSNAETFEHWTFEDHDNAGWVYDADKNSLKVHMTTAKQPWVFTPAFKTVAGEHRLDAAFMTFNGTKPEDVDIYLCTTPSSDDANKTLISSETYMTGLTQDKSVTFTVPENGRYNIGYKLCSDDNWTCHLQKSDIFLVKATNGVENILADGQFGLFYAPDTNEVGVAAMAATVQVYALDGRCVARADLNAGETLSIQHLNSGTYIIRATGDAKASVMKIQK